MHNNFHFFERLVPELEAKIKGTQLLECFSQHKDELVLGFASEQTPQFFIRADLSSDFTCLSFAEEYARARKNSVDLFTEFIGLEVLAVTLFENERAFRIIFSNDCSLLFKLFGNRSNIVSLAGESVASLFKNSMGDDWNLTPQEVHRPLDQSEAHFEAMEGRVKKVFPTLGPVPFAYWDEQDVFAPTFTHVQEVIIAMRSGEFRVSRVNGKLHLSLLPVGEEVARFSDPIEAITSFYRIVKREGAFDRERGLLEKGFKKELKEIRSYVKKVGQRLRDLEEGQAYEKVADVIMANLHQIQARTEQVTLFNFYTNSDIEIKLNPTWTPQKNAERFYRKGKNQKIELGKLKENLAAAEEKQLELEMAWEELATFTQLSEVREFAKKWNPTSKGKNRAEEPAFKQFDFEGFRIMVGRNSRNNDELTQRVAQKNDLWLHAKDVSGSHVVVRFQAGKTFPKPVVEAAAAVAAFYSKRKTETLCPVIYTEKKYVRKVKGMPPGAVRVDKEQVLMVEPKDIPQVLGGQ